MINRTRIDAGPTEDDVDTVRTGEERRAVSVDSDRVLTVDRESVRREGVSLLRDAYVERDAVRVEGVDSYFVRDEDEDRVELERVERRSESRVDEAYDVRRGAYRVDEVRVVVAESSLESLARATVNGRAAELPSRSTDSVSVAVRRDVELVDA